MFSTSMRAKRAVLFAAASFTALAAPAALSAQSTTPGDVENSPAIVVRNDLNPSAPPPGGVLDNVVDVTGVGQMRTIANLAAGTGFVCSGTLINPRTVIFAAHCVNSVPQSAYGDTTNGVPISFGFSADNLAARRIWAGLDPVTLQPNPDTSLKFKTNTARNLFNVEQVWYDQRSLQPEGFEFLQADVALATLDTHADNIPTWAMLFTPLTEPTHALVNGYGTFGNSTNPSQGLDSRRRIAENMIDFMGSLDDRDRLLFTDLLGFPLDPPFGVSTNYQLDFDDPAGVGGFNFNIFGGSALTREGTTAGGDSGGPLIVDQKYAQKVVAGVLSGGTRFFNGQPFSTYGTTSFYQPLFLYWDVIVANNPYVYASAKAGNGSWFDPKRWVQDLDPNYKIDVDGQLVTGLPNTEAQGIATNTPKFGTVCANGVNGVQGCASITGSNPEPSGTPIQIAGGPGTTNFVPNNVSGDRATGKRASYYEVTLNKAGITSLTRAATIDRLNLTGAAGLTISAAGNLTVLGDYTQTGGTLIANGTLKTGEAFVGTGILSGSGKIDPTFLTVVRGVVAPGTYGTTGTLTIQGDVILSSASLTNIDVTGTVSDKLAITGDAQNTGIAALAGNLLVTRATGATTAPRDGQVIEIISAAGGVDGRFANVLGSLGVLRPNVTYAANTVTLSLSAGSLRSMAASSSPTVNAVAGALDAIRTGGYTDLYGIYGAIDVMESGQLANTLAGFAPRVATIAQLEADEQRSMVLGMVGDRLSMIGTSRAQPGTFAVIGAPETLGLAVGQTSVSGATASQRSFIGSVTNSGRAFGALPENVSGFISGGYEAGRPGERTKGSQRSTWHIAMGVEMEAAENLTLGTAFGFVSGRSNLIGSQAETETSQAIGYGSYRLSRRAYVAGMASVTNTAIGVQRGVSTGLDQFSLNGQTNAMSYDLHLETGMNFGIAKGLTLTPRAAIRYASTDISGFRERGGEAALAIDDIKERRLEGRLGVRMSGSVNAGSGWSFAPELGVDQVQAFSTSGSEIQVRFANVSGFAFALPGLSRDTAWTEVKGGMKLTNGVFSFGAGVESSLGRSDYRDNRAVASVGIKF